MSLMVLFNYATKELTAKVVFYGPGLCGKTTNLQWIHEKLPIKNKGKMLSLATETDRTLFFDFLPIELGAIRGMKTRIQLYTVPGQVFYNATRRMVLKGADCVVFVADSQEPMLEANLESLRNLRENLEANEINPSEIPMVLQFNKRDLPNALPIEILNERMNNRNHPFFEAVALKGIGVEETLKGATSLVFRSLAFKYGEAAPTASASPRVTADTPPLPVPATPRPQPVSTAPPFPRPVAAPPAPRPAPVVRPVAVVPSAAVETVSPEELLESLEIDMPDSVDEVHSTLVRGEVEVAELRRKLREPEPMELDLDEHLESSLMEELTLDGEPIEPNTVPPVVEPPPFPPERPSGRITQPPWVGTADPVLRREPEPTPEPRLVAAIPRSVVASPVSVEISASAGPTQVAIPVEIQLEDGGAQVVIQLRLTLNLKLK
jgi:mutual gliding-motility protein MglA